MSEPLADRRLIAADPVADRDLTSTLVQVRRRVLVEIDRPVARARRRRMVPVAIAATAAVAVGAALLPASGGDRDGGVIPVPVQAFADDLGGDGILHVVTRTSAFHDAPGARIRPPTGRIELWWDLDGPRWRLRIGRPTSSAFAEWVSDGRGRVAASRRGPLEWLDPAQVDPAWRTALMPYWLPDLRSALHAGTARVVSGATVGGRPAYRVTFDLVPRDGYDADTHVFVARDEHHAMLRIDRLGAPVSPDSLRVVSRSQVLAYDVLPDTPDHRRLLRPTVPRFDPRSPPPFPGVSLTDGTT
jgi:hypothetical protein